MTNGVLSNSKPCIMCCHLLKQFGIRRVYYSNDDGNISILNVKDLDLKDHEGTKSMEQYFKGKICRFKRD